MDSAHASTVKEAGGQVAGEFDGKEDGPAVARAHCELGSA